MSIPNSPSGPSDFSRVLATSRATKLSVSTILILCSSANFLLSTVSTFPPLPPLEILLVIEPGLPILQGYSDFVEGKTYTMLPVMAILGYGEITTTSPPRERVKKSALHLFLYSLGLLFLAVASSQNNSLILLTALFSPVGHEFIIWMGMREEVNKKPIYIKPIRGVKVLNVIKGSPAYRTGIRTDDIVMGINGMPTDDSYFLQVLLSNLQGSVNLEVKRDKTQLYLNY
jgi:hypothetical protein